MHETLQKHQGWCDGWCLCLDGSYLPTPVNQPKTEGCMSATRKLDPCRDVQYYYRPLPFAHSNVSGEALSPHLLPAFQCWSDQHRSYVCLVRLYLLAHTATLTTRLLYTSCLLSGLRLGAQVGGLHAALLECARHLPAAGSITAKVRQPQGETLGQLAYSSTLQCLDGCSRTFSGGKYGSATAMRQFPSISCACARATEIRIACRQSGCSKHRGSSRSKLLCCAAQSVGAHESSAAAPISLVVQLCFGSTAAELVKKGQSAPRA